MTSKGEDRVRLIMAATDDAKISCCTVAWLHTHARRKRETREITLDVDEDSSWVSVHTRVEAMTHVQVGSSTPSSSVSIAVLAHTSIPVHPTFYLYM